MKSLPLKTRWLLCRIAVMPRSRNRQRGCERGVSVGCAGRARDLSPAHTFSLTLGVRVHSHIVRFPVTEARASVHVKGDTGVSATDPESDKAFREC